MRPPPYHTVLLLISLSTPQSPKQTRQRADKMGREPLRGKDELPRRFGDLQQSGRAHVVAHYRGEDNEQKTDNQTKMLKY